MRNGHTSPFEQVVLTFHAKMPIFVARQWVRHRTARLNELSGRYSILAEEFYLPAGSDIRRQSNRNKQGRSSEEVPVQLQQRVINILRQDQSAGYASYQEMLKDDISRELARINLPLSVYTQWYWQIDLHNLFHFLRIRLDPHAQLETRRYAEVMATMTKAVAPTAYEAFEEHVFHSFSISRSQAERLMAFLQSAASQSPEAAQLLEALRRE
jgi:thymidylate synthase (FAD)